MSNIQVEASAAWQKACSQLPKVTSPFDWTYTSEYLGTSAAAALDEERSDESIDFEKLKQPDPLLFYETVPLYEDELADNGCAEVQSLNFNPNQIFLTRAFR